MARRLSLRTQLLLVQVVIVVSAVVGVGAAATLIQARQIRDSYEQQLIGVAQSVARLPAVRGAFDDPEPTAEIQEIAEVIRKASGVTYVVVTDDQGIRYSHPNPARIGERVSTDPSVPLSGEVFVGTQTGTLGESWRVKVPVRDDDGTVIGSVSVGILESQLREDLLAQLPRLIGWVAGAAFVGLLGAYAVSRMVWRRIHRLEPEEIAELLDTRDALLHGIGEGFVALDADERISLVNDEAVRLLALPHGCEGEPAADVLDPEVLDLLGGDAGESRLVLAGERILVARRTDALVGGRRVGTALVLRDRTELHSVLRDLDGARDLTSALRAQAHEFANVMHTVSGLIELDQPAEAVSFIERSGYGGALTDNALAPGITDPAVTALLMAKTTTARERGVAVTLDPASTCGADGGTDTVTVLGNLVDNATVAALPVVGREAGRVRVALRQEGSGALHITVDDDGPGVAPADRSRVFDPGFSTSPGTARGIGLALVARIVARRGGSVQVLDGPLGGARFEVTLPARAPAAPGTARGLVGGGVP